MKVQVERHSSEQWAVAEIYLEYGSLSVNNNRGIADLVSLQSILNAALSQLGLGA